MSTPSKGVKDIVGIYETRGSSIVDSGATKLPPQTPARFLHHPLLKTPRKEYDRTDVLRESGGGSPNTSGSPSNDPAQDRSQLLPPQPPTTRQVSRIEPSRSTTFDSIVADSNPPPPFEEFSYVASSTSTVAPSTPPPAKHILLPPKWSNTATSEESYPLNDFRMSITSTRPSTLFPRQSPYAHSHHVHSAQSMPVPARTLFSRKAQPLSLPELDRLLEKIPEPRFSITTEGPHTAEDGNGVEESAFEEDLLGTKLKKRRGPQNSNIPIFPPMELLSSTSIMDLKHNSSEPPIWRDRNSIFSSLANWAIGIMGSSLVASFYSLQGVYDTVQIFALLLGSVVPLSDLDTSSQWRKLLLGTIPNVLALNFAPALTQSIGFLVFFQCLSFGLLWYFHRATAPFIRDRPIQEGLLGSAALARGKGWGVLVVSFVLLILYLPISTIAVHALVWSDDFWPVSNPYKNATSFPPDVAQLGPPNEFRDALDFCWTTTMKQESFNFAPFVVIISLFTFAAMTVYFPIRLWHTTKQCLPRVDDYSDLGRPRSATELQHEYQRLLSRDQNPLSFLYNEYRRSWGTYKSIYLLAKLFTLLTIAIVDPNNCLFRNYNRTKVDIIRQSVLVTSMFGALLLQCFMAPFIDPVSNASEWTSRASYFVTSGVGLLVALNVKGKDVINGPVLYIIYFLTYGLNIYFTFMNFSWMQRLVKRLARRIDFSIDIFSPHIDLSPSSIHTKRRIYQETISTLLLATPDCRMPKTQKMIFSEPQDAEWPPYLLGFKGTPAERHAENLKILREVGSMSFVKGIDMCYGVNKTRFLAVQEIIQNQFVGPDSFWVMPNNSGSGLDGCLNCFGNAWWIPFPPTLVLQYDFGSLAVLKTLEEFEDYVSQNLDPLICKKKEVRLALRALDGQVVFWPYTHTELVGGRSWWPRNSSHYKIQSTTHFESCAFNILRKGDISWDGLRIGSGFEVQMRYARHVKLNGSIIGLDDDVDLTPQLSRFLLANRLLVNKRMPIITAALESYRKHLKIEAKWKREVLSYRFLSAIYDYPSSPSAISDIIQDIERDFRVRRLPQAYQTAFVGAHERMRAVSRSEVTAWWYLFWDDFWRRNYQTIGALTMYETDFNPRYPTSIAYRPLPRPILEAFLSQRGLLAVPAKFFQPVHTGFINKVYLRLNHVAFHGSDKIVHAHIGDKSTDLDMTEVDIGTQGGPSSFGTGGGTDHDDLEIRARPAYKWEGILNDPMHKGPSKRRWRPWKRFEVWFGLTPRSITTFRTNGVAFDVKLSQGRYVIMDEDGEK